LIISNWGKAVSFLKCVLQLAVAEDKGSSIGLPIPTSIAAGLSIIIALDFPLYIPDGPLSIDLNQASLAITSSTSTEALAGSPGPNLELLKLADGLAPSGIPVEPMFEELGGVVASSSGRGPNPK
jgi:hypothetical protein